MRGVPVPPIVLCQNDAVGMDDLGGRGPMALSL
jgi:hypothetical protein